MATKSTLPAPATAAIVAIRTRSLKAVGPHSSQAAPTGIRPKAARSNGRPTLLGSIATPTAETTTASSAPITASLGMCALPRLQRDPPVRDIPGEDEIV